MANIPDHIIVDGKRYRRSGASTTKKYAQRLADDQRGIGRKARVMDFGKDPKHKVRYGVFSHG